MFQIRECGGCQGKGSHKRWCIVAVGPRASNMGMIAEKVGQLADTVGPNEHGSANLLWQAEARLRARAQQLAEEFRAARDSTDVREAKR